MEISDWKKGAAFISALQKAKTSSIHALSSKWSEVYAFYRFLNNERVTEEVIQGKLMERCHLQARNKKVIAIADTTALNYSQHRNRKGIQSQLGPLSDQYGWGYFMHPVYCLNGETGFPLGIAHVRLWSRPKESIKHTRHDRVITEKESDKWYTDLMIARDTTLCTSKHVTFVMDREADVYPVLDHLPNPKTDIVVRSKSNRLVRVDNKEMRLAHFFSRQEVLGVIDVHLKHNPLGRRKIRAEVRCGKVNILKPKHHSPMPPGISDTVEMYVVEVKQISRKTEDIVHWKLLTSIPVSTFEQCLEVIDIYKQRWHIEEIFRIMKSQSFDLESSGISTGITLRKLGLFVLEASVKIAQLKAARSAESPVEVMTIFSSSEIACLKLLNSKLQGNTEKQTNPFNPESLSWASWVIARLGGWKSYQSQRPPGSITFKRGLERFEDIYVGYLLNFKDMYKP